MSITGLSSNSDTISGNGHLIFSVSSSAGKVTISNLTLVNGNNSDGGAIHSDDNEGLNGNELNIDHCVFKGNRSANGGGAIYSDGSAELNIDQSSFVSNQANEGGAIDDTAGPLTVANSFFSGNVTRTSGTNGGRYSGRLVGQRRRFAGGH